MKRILLLIGLMVSVSCYAQENRTDDVKKLKQTKREQKRIQWDIDHPTKKTSTPRWLKDLLNGEESFGFTYNYGKHYPYGASLNYSYSMFMLSLDFGINNDGDKYYTYNNDITIVR